MTKRQIDALARFLPVFRKPGYRFARQMPPRVKGGVVYLQPLRYSREVNAFLSALYREKVVLTFDWVSWQSAGQAYLRPSNIARAKLPTLQRLLTLHARKERFCEGHLGEMLSRGHIQRILARLLELRPVAQ